MRPDSLMYIDNTDAGGRSAAKQLLKTLPQIEVRYYTDLAPGLGAPTTGMVAYVR
jgi:hypothetical protein